MVQERLPGQTGAIFHFRPYGRFPGGGRGLSKHLTPQITVKVDASASNATKLSFYFLTNDHHHREAIGGSTLHATRPTSHTAFFSHSPKTKPLKERGYARYSDAVPP